MSLRMLSKIFLIPVLFVTVIGCQKNLGLVQVQGIITCGGKTVPAAGSISFTPAGGQNLDNVRRGMATFGADGKFVASTYEQGDGLLPGKYIVRIECWEISSSINGSEGVSLIDRKYLGPETVSGIPPLEIVSGQPQTDIIFDVAPADEKTIEAEKTAHQAVEVKASKPM